jgi:hypothetical protein
MARNKVDRDVPARFPSLFRNAKVAEKSDALRAWGIAIAPGRRDPPLRPSNFVNCKPGRSGFAGSVAAVNPVNPV